MYKYKNANFVWMKVKNKKIMDSQTLKEQKIVHSNLDFSYLLVTFTQNSYFGVCIEEL